MKKFCSISPLNDEIIYSFEFHTNSQVTSMIKRSVEAQEKWGLFTLNDRVTSFQKIKKILDTNKNKYALSMAKEMGKPIDQGILEIEKCILLLKFYENNILTLTTKNFYNVEPEKNVVYKPLGVVLGIMPWNFPFWQAFRFAIPVLLSGNTVMLKHALNVQQSALHIEEIFSRLDLPINIYQNLRLSDRNTTQLVKSKSISAVSFTGGSKAGSIVAKMAGTHLKKVLLELGGSDPLIILSDANIDKAISCCIASRLLNAGQSCISAKRIIVAESIYELFVNKLILKLKQKIVGNPREKVDLGPMVSKKARSEVHNQVENTKNKGAKLMLGGEIPKGKGSFYPITVLTEVKPGMETFDEEVFGPVFSITKAKNEMESVRLANKSSYGLGASIFTENIKKARRICDNELNVGICYINDFVKSDPELPFGGIKESGFGRELSLNGFLEFVNVKTIVVNKI